LGRLRARPCAAMVGRFAVVGGEARFEPWTALFDEPQKLAFRRAGLVQEVHLALEPLPGEVGTDRAPPPEKRTRAARDGVSAELAAVRELVVELWSCGVASVDPDIREALAERAEAVRALHPHLAEGLAELGAAMGTVGASAVLHRVTAHVRLLSGAWGVERLRARERPAGPVATRRGEDLRVVPIGAEWDRRELVIVGLDAVTGAPVELRDPIGPCPDGVPADAPVASRLFQDHVRLADVLAREIQLLDHPVTHGRACLVRPAWHTRPQLGAPIGALALPEVDVPRRGPPHRLRLIPRRGPAGWSWWTARGEADVVVDELLAFDLEKRSVLGGGELDVVLVGRGDRFHVLRVEDTFPTVDPGATRWSLDRLRSRAAGTGLAPAVEALGGAPAQEPGADGVAATALAMGEGGPRWLASQVAAVASGVRDGEPLPAAASLWAWGRVLRPDGPPIDALGMPVERIRAAIVGPLARWLRGADPDEQTEEALLLLRGTSELANVLEARV
ncbi:MAG: hypothetical protein KC621_25900, partial [Myxococcales bacterium]|nr:hypothetical protein [Myxococcales bacterium]